MLQSEVDSTVCDNMSAELKYMHFGYTRYPVPVGHHSLKNKGASDIVDRGPKYHKGSYDAYLYLHPAVECVYMILQTFDIANP